ncbi:MAG: hypothetical protein IH863_00940 [Chloroflexi bacterium]|nr:hypothetical protein [Chloroflexota bacterium]
MPPHVQGDADCNETVDVKDVLAVLQTLGGAAVAACSAYADVNCDGIVSGADAVIILRHVSQLPSAIAGCPPVGATGI